MTLLDLMEGARLQDEGCTTVIDNERVDWSSEYATHADAFLALLPFGTKFTGEDVRMAVMPLLPTPHHPNVWGASARSALGRWKRAGRIEECGLGSSKSTKSHASRIPLYQVVGAA